MQVPVWELKRDPFLGSEVCNLFDGPTLLDADAIRPEIFSKLKKTENVVILPMAVSFPDWRVILLPKKWIEKNPCTLVLKGPIPKFIFQFHLYCLGEARFWHGGSGDLLAGILGTLLAKGTFPIEEGAALAVQYMAGRRGFGSSAWTGIGPYH